MGILAHETLDRMTDMELRARIHLKSAYQEYLWHATVAHHTPYESIREQRTIRAFDARNDARSAYWIIRGTFPPVTGAR